MASLDSTLAAAATAAGKPFKLIVYPEAERAYCFFAGIDHDRGKRNGTLYRNGILYSVASRDGHRIYGAPLA
jgi:hypothetical protein